MAERIDAVKTTFFGKGAVNMLVPELKKMGVKRGLIVTDPFLYETGAATRVGDVLLKADVEYAVYYQVQPNPTIDVVNECIEAARTLQVDLLVAVGGGSAIDTAKAVSIVVANGGSVEQYEGMNKSLKPGLPVVAVNTTAGTGSECTSFYIVTDPVRHSKMAMIDPNCMVVAAINDIDFMISMPPKLTAATGMDALTHAIEAKLSLRANPVTDKDANWAMETIYRFLPGAVENGSDEEARTMMAYAENVAGMAFSNAGLGMVHAMAHALGGKYNLPHGVCNAVLLPYVLAFNGTCQETRQRFVEIARAFQLAGWEDMTPEQALDAGVKAISLLSKRVGIPHSLAELNVVNPVHFGELADLALKDACILDNLIQPDRQQIIQVYQNAFRG
ncbi:iron-containing alcohol dehydrogenase [Anaeromicropila populeti]|uniref:Alcohol dehydrogenase n=1 Tax=Anaeromicropila populeti TaxID=37658 RepID=A0A1I6K8N2_9FIRM|nr:iron-containing alcohol dehydrogenase [Anaeromicropila populeti]SFR87388.1 alcohol dehydrogenase [Anaeromicropila populeti]